MAHGFLGKFKRVGQFFKKIAPHAKKLFNIVAPKIVDMAQEELERRGHGNAGRTLRKGYDALSGLRYG